VKISPIYHDYLLRNDKNIISSISVTDIVFDVYLGKWNYRAIPKVKTWSYFLTIPKYRFCHEESVSLFPFPINNEIISMKLKFYCFV
jgi:hypothetical protein